MAHDPRIVKDEDQIEELRKTVPDWIRDAGTAGRSLNSPPFRTAGRHSRGRHRRVCRPTIHARRNWRSSAPRSFTSSGRVEIHSGSSIPC